MDTLALDLLLTHGRELLSSPLLLQEKQFIQHGSINCYDHSVAVAWVSIQLALRTKAKVDFSSLVRGALLHDYFLYPKSSSQPEMPKVRSLYPTQPSLRTLQPLH